MNHLEVYQLENAVMPIEQGWINWCNEVEKLIGHSLDMDQIKFGCSIDYAYDLFMAGYSPFTASVEIGRSKALVAVPKA